MKLKHTFSSSLILAAAFAGAARCDEDKIALPAHPQLHGYVQVIEPTIVPACSADGWLVETSFRMQVREDLLRERGGAATFQTFAPPLKKMINDAVASRPGENAILTQPRRNQTADTGIAAELSQGIDKLIAPYEEDRSVRILIGFDTVSFTPGGCSPAKLLP